MYVEGKMDRERPKRGGLRFNRVMWKLLKYVKRMRMIKTNGRQGQGKGGRPKIVGSKCEVNEDEDDLSRTSWLQIMSFSKKK